MDNQFLVRMVCVTGKAYTLGCFYSIRKAVEVGKAEEKRKGLGWEAYIEILTPDKVYQDGLKIPTTETNPQSII